MEFLRNLLAGGSRPVKEIEEEAKAAGVSRMTLRRARESLEIVPKKKGYFPGEWHWELPQKEGVAAQPETVEDVEDDHLDHMSKGGDLLLEDAHPPYSLKNDDHLREDVTTFDKNREDDHVRGDNGRNRYVSSPSDMQ
jgi:hypothetical protein